MKISTYKKVLLGIWAALLFIQFNEEKWLPLIFPSDKLVIYETSVIKNWIMFLAVPAVLVIFDRFFKLHGYKKMTKLGNIFFMSILVAVIAVPLMFYPARTEITSEKITCHNLFGQVSKVYEIKDAEKVTAGISAGKSSRYNTTPRFKLTYEITFDDGYTYGQILSNYESDNYWIITTEMDDILKNNGVTKEIYGEAFLDKIFDYNGLKGYSDKVEKLMKK